MRKPAVSYKAIPREFLFRPVTLSITACVNSYPPGPVPSKVAGVREQAMGVISSILEWRIVAVPRASRASANEREKER